MSGTGTINFQTIPANVRNPGVFAELDPSNANTAGQQTRALIIGQILPTGAATPNVPLISAGPNDAIVQGGAGSMLALMTAAYVASDPVGEVWYLPLSDASGSTAAALTFTIAGTATANGTIELYIAGTNIPVTVASGTTAAAVATALVTAINATANLPVVATSTTTATVTLTALNKGLAGNDIDVRVNYYGAVDGETTPAGLTYTGISSGTGTQLSGGATNPTLTIALANLTNKTFDYVAFPYTDTISLNAWQAFENATAGRWSYSQMLYGHAFAGLRGTFSSLVTAGTARNDPAMTIMGFYDSPTPAWIWAACLAAVTAVSVRANPALPLQYLPLNVLAPPLINQFNFSESNTLLFDGVSTFQVNAAGQVSTWRLCTTYQLNPQGQPDNSYLDVETRYTLAYLIRDLVQYLATLYGRKVLVANGARISGGVSQSVTTAAIVQTSVVNRYRYQESQGLVQNSSTFAANVQVINAGNGTLKILWPGDIANQLRIIEILVAFTKT